MKEIDFYLDLATNFINTEEYLQLTTSPIKKMDNFDRIRVTVRLPDKYFEDKVDRNIQGEVKVLCDE